MTLSANKLTQLEKFIEKMLDEELTHEEGRQLNRILLDSQDARTYYRRYINVHYGLIARYSKGLRTEVSYKKGEFNPDQNPNASDFQPEPSSPLDEVKRRAALAVPKQKTKLKEPSSKVVKAKAVDELDVLAEAASEDENIRRRSSTNVNQTSMVESVHYPVKSGVRWEYIIFTFAILILAGIVVYIYTQNNNYTQTPAINAVATFPQGQRPTPNDAQGATNPNPKPASAIKISRPTGQVFLVRHGIRNQIAGAMDLQINDQVVTQEGASAIIEVPTIGTLVSVQESTRFQFENRADAIRLTEGRIHILSNKPNQTDQLKIYTEKALIQPIGTQFDVTVSEIATRVNVSEGSVSITRLEDMKTIILEKNQYAVLQLDVAFSAVSEGNSLPITPQNKPNDNIASNVKRPRNKDKSKIDKPDFSDLAYKNTSQTPPPVAVIPAKKKSEPTATKPAPKPSVVGEAVIVKTPVTTPPAVLEQVTLPAKENAILHLPLDKIREDHYWDDISNASNKLNLVVVDSTAVVQSSDHTSLLIESSINSTGYASELAQKVKKSNQISLALWVNPTNELISNIRIPKTKPNYIISIAEDMNTRNFTLSQIGPVYALRFRCSRTNKNGLTDMRDTWLLETAPVVKNEWQHLAYTYGKDRILRLYVNGSKAAERQLDGDLSNWDEKQLLVIGNEADDRKNRGWVGKLSDIQVYDYQLSSKEIQALFLKTKPESDI